MRDRLLVANLFILSFLCLISSSEAQHSVARQWNEALLAAIRTDFARPTVHARNLFHSSVAMYDCWATYDDNARPFFLGDTVGGYYCPFDGISKTDDLKSAREESMSYAVYRLLRHRFVRSPGKEVSYAYFDSLFLELGYDTAFVSIDYSTGNPAALGNYLAQELINFGTQDGANEVGDYENLFYRAVNPSLAPEIPGNAFLRNPNRWQPLTFETFIDQSGNPIPGGAPPFLSPEWGLVTPFSLKEEDLDIYERYGNEYWVYHDPGEPAYIEIPEAGGNSAEYQWNFALVAIWSSQLDPADSVMWDISPASMGNIPSSSFPTTMEGLHDFYLVEAGGDLGPGHNLNPHTNQPYEPQIVPRGDYARVLAEFWADGPDSETPPGHWFTILNYVNDNPVFEKRFKGTSSLMDELEWDVKAYFILGGTMHDVAISSWGIKGWYDYIRPISAIRGMAERGQSSKPEQDNYHPAGMPLKAGYIEEVGEGDLLAGDNGEHIGKIKFRAWRGPDYIEDPDTSVAGVGWILADNWWPYQRPTFVTPPFAGYVSGHSTFSRAAAEVLTLLTGDAYFPGGMGEFECPKNEFLVFEDGPSRDLTLQWATYRDASDQCSLSRIWGGIHPPLDDIPGRLVGEIIGIQAFEYAESYFGESPTTIDPVHEQLAISVYPNPLKRNQQLNITIKPTQAEKIDIRLINANGQLVQYKQEQVSIAKRLLTLDIVSVPSGFYLVQLKGNDWQHTLRVVID